MSLREFELYGFGSALSIVAGKWKSLFFKLVAQRETSIEPVALRQNAPGGILMERRDQPSSHFHECRATCRTQGGDLAASFGTMTPN